MKIHEVYKGIAVTALTLPDDASVFVCGRWFRWIQKFNSLKCEVSAISAAERHGVFHGVMASYLVEKGHSFEALEMLPKRLKAMEPE